MLTSGDRDAQTAPEGSFGAVSNRIRALLAEMTIEEKLAQIVGLWVAAGSGGEVVAPLQDAMLGEEAPKFEAFATHGLGHLTRIFGTRPVEPAEGRRALWEAQRWLVENTRLGIPAIAHEECLTGLAAWKAATFPTALSWGASFDPDLVERMGAAIGDSMARLGVHQGLAPVLDVVRDARWGRVEECISEDPYVVGTVGTAYVRGLQSAGVMSTLKHFVGYSASRAGRNLAPVSAGPREVADVLLPPFEMAVREGGARSVMHSYAEVDGMPPAANNALLTGLLRDTWGFEGTVVADYFGISFLELLQGVAADAAQAAGRALAAGVDGELPTVRCYGEPLLEAVRSGAVDEALVDRAATRVLEQKAQLGLLDPGWSAVPPVLSDLGDDAYDVVTRGSVDLDLDADREVARELAEKSIVLLRNESALPLAATARIAVVGPRADDPLAMMGCYSFPSHVLTHHTDVPLGLSVPTLLDAVRAELPDAQVSYAEGCGVSSPDLSGIPAAVALADEADVVVVAVGDQAGLFGRGTSGEGCDAPDLRLPGVQGALLDALLDTGKAVIIVLLTGRPYALGRFAPRA